ncbi:MAG TPA: TlpA disulfide reductase family protein [Chitinophagaceae bacterium]|nr:TlpA disulfide reductase family protein [Chitinophagaceae bacterium]
MTRTCFGFLALLVSFHSKGQRIVMDKDRKFLYSDSAGVTASYISYFGNRFAIPGIVTIDGKTINPADLQGKTVVYNFWFVACKPCVAEIPALNKLVKKYQSDSMVFIAITFDKETRIREFLKKRGFNFQITNLPQAEIDSLKKIAFYPFTAIVTKTGKLSFALFARPMGKNDEEGLFELLSSQIEKVLHEQ